MSRYLLLVLLNVPLLIAGMMNTVVGYKLGHMGRRRFIFGLVFWIAILAMLIFAKPIYTYLFSNNLTQSEPLSLFDVMQITGIIFTLFIANRAYGKVNVLERKVQDLHQELAIRLAEDKKTSNKD